MIRTYYVRSKWLLISKARGCLCFTLHNRLIYQSTEPVPVIILEDLSVLGFEVVRQPPSDFEVSKQIVRRLAKYHAATFYLHHDQVDVAIDFNVPFHTHIIFTM